MASALSANDIQTIKTAFQVPFDTFAHFDAVLRLYGESLGQFRDDTQSTDYNIKCYKKETETSLPHSLDGYTDSPNDIVFINPAELAISGVVAENGKYNITEGVSCLRYEGREYNITKSTHIGWFEGAYQLIKLQLTAKI